MMDDGRRSNGNYNSDLLLLAPSLLEDLPEQQTRTLHLIDQYGDDFDLKLGFDACATCGTCLFDDNDGRNNKVVECPNCRGRIRYCSEDCRYRDANVVAAPAGGAVDDDDENGRQQQGEEDAALGHTSVVCALLNWCADDDDAVLENRERGGCSENSTTLPSSNLEAARDRIRSEYESYPATLANVLSETWTPSSSTTARLVVHVVGASEDAELWGGYCTCADLSSKDNNNGDSVVAAGADACYDGYAEALSELAVAVAAKKNNNSSRGGSSSSSWKALLDEIDLVFVGPECPRRDVDVVKPMRRTPSTSTSSSKKNGTDSEDAAAAVVGALRIRSRRCAYDKVLLETIPPADVVVFFNPGFTCPDYDWREAVSCIPKGTPFLLTTNTELEGIADCQWLLDQDRIQALPAGLADVFGLYSAPDNDDAAAADDGRQRSNNGAAFFSVNPFCGSRVRQSGTMANDLYIKNRWMLGGIIDSFDQEKAAREQQSDAASKRQRRTAATDADTSGGNTNNNTKTGNPALV